MSHYLTRLQMVYSLALVTNFNKVLLTIQMLRNCIYTNNTTTALSVPTFTERKNVRWQQVQIPYTEFHQNLNSEVRVDICLRMPVK
jgi:hypothetical protein